MTLSSLVRNMRYDSVNHRVVYPRKGFFFCENGLFRHKWKVCISHTHLIYSLHKCSVTFVVRWTQNKPKAVVYLFAIEVWLVFNLWSIRIGLIDRSIVVNSDLTTQQRADRYRWLVTSNHNLAPKLSNESHSGHNNSPFAFKDYQMFKASKATNGVNVSDLSNNCPDQRKVKKRCRTHERWSFFSVHRYNLVPFVVVT